MSVAVESERRPALWDVRGMARPRPGAWTVLIERIAELITAVAILMDPDENNVGPWPDAIDSLLIPVRVFTTEDEAIDWLTTFVDKS